LKHGLSLTHVLQGSSGKCRKAWDNIPLGLYLFAAARPAALQIAFGTFEDVRMRAGMALMAVPLEDVRIRLDHYELVRAVCWGCHGGIMW
jgi:hypothetical protein